MPWQVWLLLLFIALLIVFIRLGIVAGNRDSPSLQTKAMGPGICCPSCGYENPNYAAFCLKCGVSQSAALKAPSIDLNALAVTAPTDIVHANGEQPLISQTIRKSVKGPYVWLTFDLFILTLLLGIVIFNMALQGIIGNAEKSGESLGKGLVPIILLLYGAHRTWKSLLEKESESDPSFKRKHRIYQRIAGTIVVIVLCSAVGFGIFVGNRVDKVNRIKYLMTQVAELGPKNLEFRQRLTAIRSVGAPTMKDYYDQCLSLERVLDEYEPHRQKVLSLQKSILIEAKDAPPEIWEILRWMREINEKDSQGIQLMRTEIDKAKELIRLPLGEQVVYYRREIVPVREEIEKVGEEELVMFREGQRKGMKLPLDIKDMLERKPIE